MELHSIETYQDFKDLQVYVENNKYNSGKIETSSGHCFIQFEDHEKFDINLNNFTVDQRNLIYTWINIYKLNKKQTFSEDSLIFGKNQTTNIVSIEVSDDSIEIFLEKDGIITSEFKLNKFWIVSSKKFDNSWQPLKGNLFYKFIKYYDNKNSFYLDKNRYRDYGIYSIADSKESYMVLNGITYYKGMKVSDVSSLFFDIESTGLNHNQDSKVLLISNTFLKNDKIERRLFSYDQYNTEAEMFDDWCNWVKTINPSILCGHNIFGYDLPYMDFCAKKAGTSLSLGRDNSDIRFDKYTSKFRKDGSQDYDYIRSHIYGREIIDTMFVAYHFDFSRKYESYGLKQIIKQEGLEVKERVFYDAGKIWENYKNPIEWEKIKQYANHDADDAMSLYKLMIPQYFYMSWYVPKSFQVLNYTATGSQLNSFLVRSYLQLGHSLPQATDVQKYKGAISFGNPGSYSNCWKIDINSLYPSVILQYQIYDKEKDPNGNFLKMVEYFTKKRLENKKKAKETGDRYYKELEQSEKQFINSAYGLLGAPGLIFNSSKNAELVTSYGRELLKKTILWATSKSFIEKQEENEEEIVNE